MARTQIVSNAEVLQTAKFNTADEVGGSAIIQEAIDEAEQEVQGDYGFPFKKSLFVLDSTQLIYEFRNDDVKTYKIERVIIRGNDNSRNEYTDGNGTASEANSTYAKDFTHNTITFAQQTVSNNNGYLVEVDYIPSAFYHLIRTFAAIFLHDYAQVVNRDDVEHATIQRLRRRADRLKKNLSHAGVVDSTDVKNYNPANGEYIPQKRFWTY